MFKKTINPAALDYALISTDGTGGISLDASSSGVSAAAIVGTGTTGQISLTLTERASADYVAVANVANANAPLAVAPLTQTATLLTLELSDLATPSVVDPAMVALTISVMIVG